MKDGISFMEELLSEVETNENLATEAYMDLLIAKVGHLEEKIASNFKSAEEEVKIINDFALSKNSRIQGQIDGIMSMLESFIRDLNEKNNNIKTISLAHGTLKLHKKPDKVEVIDLELFMNHATEELLTKLPESYKPNLNKIKNYIKMSGRVPFGVTKTDGTDEFKLTINKTNEV